MEMAAPSTLWVKTWMMRHMRYMFLLDGVIEETHRHEAWIQDARTGRRQGPGPGTATSHQAGAGTEMEAAMNGDGRIVPRRRAPYTRFERGGKKNDKKGGGMWAIGCGAPMV
jgi:hypothetical protein